MDSTNETNHLEIDNLPNRLTIFRVLLIPIVLGLLLVGHWQNNSQLGWISGWIFGLASITDFLDGYIARKRNIVTVFGSFLDPIADKFLTVSSLILLQSIGRLHVLIVIILVLREMYMTSLRLLATNEGLSVPVNNLGKWKTATQMLGIPFLMAYENWQGISFNLMGLILIYLSCILSIWSATHYTYNMIQTLKLKRNKNAKNQ